MDMKCPIKIKDYKHYYEGSEFQSKHSGNFIITNYESRKRVHIKFLDDHGYEMISNMDNIRNGTVKNPYRILKHGGYYGEGPYTVNNSNGAYKVWDGMLVRVSDFYTRDKGYINTTVCKEWYNFQIFAEWYNKYLSQLNPKYTYQIDKDIFQWNFDRKVYSSSTCCIIPARLNAVLDGMHAERSVHDLPVGVMTNNNKFSSYVCTNEGRVYLGNFNTPMEAFEAYRIAKKDFIKELSIIYYNDGAITKDVFDKLLAIDIIPY